jgi:hypothetical protein
LIHTGKERNKRPFQNDGLAVDLPEEVLPLPAGTVTVVRHAHEVVERHWRRNSAKNRRCLLKGASGMRKHYM